MPQALGAGSRSDVAAAVADVAASSVTDGDVVAEDARAEVKAWPWSAFREAAKWRFVSVEGGAASGPHPPNGGVVFEGRLQSEGALQVHTLGSIASSNARE